MDLENPLIDQVFEEGAFDAADPSQVKAARKKAKLDKDNKDRVLRAMLDQREIRKYFYEFMQSCDVFGEPFVMGDMYATARNLGRQSAGKQMLIDVQKFPDLYIKLINENQTKN